MSDWLTAAEIARVAGISERKARKALERAFKQNRSWRGARLIVRLAPASGGPGGVCYEARVGSFPTSLQADWKALQSADDRPFVEAPDDERARRGRWWQALLATALAHPPGSKERRDAQTVLIGRELVDWNNKRITLVERTIQRWMKRADQEGRAAFLAKPRRDKGAVKIFVSQTAEQAIPFPAETWERIAAELRRSIDGHWKDGATLKLIRGRANIEFRRLIVAAGFTHCHTLPDETFIVPRRFVEAGRRPLNAYAVLTKDRKQYEDTRYRVQRDRSGMMPSDWWIGDVHPVDIYCRRADGTLACARFLAWLDLATGRLAGTLVLCEAGRGIGNAEIILSFCQRLADPTWGAPKTLYIDNGREYRFAEDLEDALQLVAQLRGADGRSIRVVHARPYNAAAKPIEGLFAGLEKLLQDIEGHVGGDRLNQKSKQVGKQMWFPGTFEQLNAIVQSRLLEHEIYPMRGALRGRSPRQAYEAAVASGWQPVTVDPRQIMTVFATDRVCTITKGVIAYDNRRWVCDELASYFEPKIIARIPRFWQPEKLPLLHAKTRALVGIAEPDIALAFDDPAGAERSARMDKLRRSAITAAGRSLPTLDTVAVGLGITAQIPPAPIAAPIAQLGLSAEAEAIAEGMAETPTARADRQRERNIKAQRRQSTALENITRALNGSRP